MTIEIVNYSKIKPRPHSEPRDAPDRGAMGPTEIELPSSEELQKVFEVTNRAIRASKGY